MAIYDISRELMTTGPYAGDPEPRMHVLASHEQDGYQLQAIVMSLHAATHVDAPLHFMAGGSDISQQPLEAYYGPCTVITIPPGQIDASYFMHLHFTDRVLLRGPGHLSKSAVGYFYTRGVKLVGTDRESIGVPTDEKTIHLALLTYGIAVLENIDLSGVPDGQYTISCAPLRIGGAEGAPCRAILIK